MKDFAKQYLDMFEELPLWAKVLLSLFWALPGGLYRFSKSALAESELGMALAVIVTILFGEIMILVDIITLLICRKILWFGKPKKEKAPKTEKTQ